MSMTNKEKIELYKNTIEHFGKEKQCLKAIEEFAEVQQQLVKHLLDPQSINIKANLCEEIADAEIMLEQLMMMFSIKQIDTLKEFKLKRLKALINR